MNKMRTVKCAFCKYMLFVAFGNAVKKAVSRRGFYPSVATGSPAREAAKSEPA